ncbi:hypothetical protein HJFPF1_03156 [Paramyrothecium foliicola]|nr:hypothetical protein HJFPF1_03156 [Paramyrothecium foliicola]
MAKATMALLLASPAVVAAQAAGGCISLQGSTACSAFQSASVSTSQQLINLFSFLRFVSDRSSFDEQLSSYVRTTYLQEKFQNTFQCGNVNFNGSDELYPRFTTSVICNAIVQNSVDACNLSTENARPLCADACADFAQSEAYLTADDSLCSNPRGDLNNLIRADFINCQLPEGSLDLSTCIPGITNEPANCGFASSTIGFCSYCAEGGINSTDTCCYNANAEQRCQGVELPVITNTISLSTVTASSSPTSTGTSDSGATDAEDDGGSSLSGGAIAGIVIGALAGLAILAALLFFCCRRMKRRPGSQQGSIFNQPSPARQGASMSQAKEATPQGYEVLPGGRVARMSALEGHNGDSNNHHHGSALAAGAAGAGAGYVAGRRKHGDRSSSEDYAYTPVMDTRQGPPATSRRNGSLSSNSILGSSVPQSPTSAGDFSSPLPVASQQSEQLPFFKDYYSQDDIHPGDRVAVLWAYQPRAPDEFTLERGDMLKVVGIWDDGWATGILSNERVDEWEARRQAQRDSGVSNASGRRDESPVTSGEIKAFPLVCVCIPDHWRKTIEGDGSTEAGSSGHPGHSALA